MKTVLVWNQKSKIKDQENKLTEKERIGMQKSVSERATMENRSTQNVVIKFNKYLISREYIQSFTVNIKIPLRRTEIMERMAAAFPGLEIYNEGS